MKIVSRETVVLRQWKGKTIKFENFVVILTVELDSFCPVLIFTFVSGRSTQLRTVPYEANTSFVKGNMYKRFSFAFQVNYLERKRLSYISLPPSSLEFNSNSGNLLDAGVDTPDGVDTSDN